MIDASQPLEDDVTTALQQQVSALRADVLTARSERELLTNELALRDAALDAGMSHFMIVDAEPTLRPIVYINRACANAHGYEPHELLGRSVRTLVFREQTAEFGRLQFQKTMERGESIRAEAEVVRRDGSTFWAGFVTTPLLDSEGRFTHFVTVGADITARREAERRREELQEQLLTELRERERMSIELRLAQKLEAVGRLATGLAHEINTPIQYVSDSVHFLRASFSELERLCSSCRAALSNLAEPLERRIAAIEAIETEMEYHFMKAEVPRAFERTLEGTERVAAIIRAMMEFAHPDAMEHAPADLNHALSTTLAIARNEYKYLAQIATDFAELPAIDCNIGELNQVFLNLIVNAAHAIQDAGKTTSTGRIDISTRLRDSSIEIAIADNGCGIDAENVNRIFDPFFTTKEVGRGTGQGLAIAHSIVVEKHGGQISVTSAPGAGSCFTLKLPLARAMATADSTASGQPVQQTLS